MCRFHFDHCCTVVGRVIVVDVLLLYLLQVLSLKEFTLEEGGREDGTTPERPPTESGREEKRTQKEDGRYAYEVRFVER